MLIKLTLKMVLVSSILMRTQRTFIDSLRIFVSGGKGGNGLPKYGGVGGKGGDVYVRASNKYTLKRLKEKFPEQIFKAGRGDDSRKTQILGQPGEDCYIKCCSGVSVVSPSQRILGDLNNPGDTVLVAKGGCGGNALNNFLGQNGQAHTITLDLKLIADVGFVGFPNAGKSTLLKALSNAQPKIASYPFTTIEPNIGILQYEDLKSIRAADLPGLIEGAHLNYGMGHKFLKHCIRTKLLLFIVDIEGFRLSPKHDYRSAFETVLLLNRELELYDEDLLQKPVLLAVNKMDTEGSSEKLNDLKYKLKHVKEYINDIPRELQPSKLIRFDAVIPISSKDRMNIQELKGKLRTFIDIYHEKENLRTTETESNRDSEESSVIYL